MSFQSSLSGLNQSALALDVIGNNIANASTVGFKTARPHFADVFAAAVTSGANSTSAGLGVTAGVVQTFTQGDVSSTNNPLDMAISGRGFFRVNDDGTARYTRNGEFHLVGELDAAGGSFTPAELANQNALVVNNEGLPLTGYLAEYTTDPKGTIDTSAKPQDIVIVPTMPGAASTRASFGVNLDSRVTPPTAAFDPANAASFTGIAAATAYDAAGDPHSLTVYFRKDALPNTWQVYTTLDGVQTGPNTLTFDSFGNLQTGSPATLTYGGAVPSLTLDLAETTQHGAPYGINSTVTDGYADGMLTGVSVAADGTIYASYTNSQLRKAAQVVLAEFANPAGLSNQGNNLWAETDVSGKASLDTPKNPDPKGLGLGAITGRAVEAANVDLGAELINMIVQQRYYQANAQSIKAQDQLLQTLSGIR